MSDILRLKCTKFDFRWGSAPDPLGELIACSWWGRGHADPISNSPTPNLGSSGLELSAVRASSTLFSCIIFFSDLDMSEDHATKFAT